MPADATLQRIDGAALVAIRTQRRVSCRIAFDLLRHPRSALGLIAGTPAASHRSHNESTCLMSKAITPALWNQAAPPEMSQAREAAEAAFAPRTADRQDGPLVVVKRTRSIGTSAGDHQAPQRSMPDDDDRKTRVFRVRSVQALHGEREEFSQDTTRSLEAPSVPQHKAMASASHRRSRRNAFHGKVTIIRPPSPDQSTAGSTPGATERDYTAAGLPMVHRDTIARYEAVMAEIESLKRLAAVLKRNEARSAARWIRKAIAEHGLTAQDLGL
jgi:hypothetical protein